MDAATEAESKLLTESYLEWLRQNGLSLSPESRPVLAREDGKICVRGVVPFTQIGAVVARHPGSSTDADLTGLPIHPFDPL